MQTSSMAKVGVGSFLFAGLLVIEALGAGSTSALSIGRRQLSDGPGLTNHPVNLVPSSDITVPDGWPLGDDGSITCLTCHEPRPSHPEMPAAKLRDPSRDAVDRAGFCGTCHATSSGHSGAGMHWRALGVAHIHADQTHDGAMRQVLDGATKACLGCHDGVTAGDSHQQAAWARDRGYVGGSIQSHPVGVQYPAWSARENGSKFRPAASVPHAVRLPGGRVSCVSCHDLYANHEGLLAVPLEGSRLCFACHDME